LRSGPKGRRWLVWTSATMVLVLLAAAFSGAGFRQAFRELSRRDS
jgi:hypothetical protein